MYHGLKGVSLSHKQSPFTIIPFPPFPCPSKKPDKLGAGLEKLMLESAGHVIFATLKVSL